MSLLSIPSYKTDDPNYRYKMPRLVAKVEGRGNGIKTNIVNMGDIARALKRPPDYPTKFCGTELGAQSKFDPAEGKAIVNGAHEQRDLQALIDKFIEKFVLCENCRLPEIDLIVKKGRVQYSCNACGKKGEVDNAHKLATFIIKNPPGGADSTMGAKKKTAAERREEKAAQKAARSKAVDEKSDGGEEKKSKKKSSKDGSKTKTSLKKTGSVAVEKKETLDSASTDESDAAKQSEKKTKKKKSKKPAGEGGGAVLEELDQLTYCSPETLDVIRRMIGFLCGETKVPATEIDASVAPEAFFDHLRVLQMAQGFDHVLKFYVALEALFASSLRGLTASTLEQRAKYLKPVAAHTSSTDILTAMQDFVYLRAGSEVVPEGFKGYPAILYSFYDNNLLSADEIMKYYADPSRKKAAKTSTVRHPHGLDAFTAACDAAKPFLDWLGEESEDEEDEDPEDSGSADEADEAGADMKRTSSGPGMKSIGTVESSTVATASGSKRIDLAPSEEDDDDSDVDIDAL